jgi:hypothetical protein
LLGHYRLFSPFNSSAKPGRHQVVRLFLERGTGVHKPLSIEANK